MVWYGTVWYVRDPTLLTVGLRLAISFCCYSAVTKGTRNGPCLCAESVENYRRGEQEMGAVMWSIISMSLKTFWSKSAARPLSSIFDSMCI